MTDIVDPAAIRQAAAEVQAAHQHFAETRGKMAEAIPGEHLMGGYGKTGAYCANLNKFTHAFDDVLGQFLAEEDKFVQFLQNFHDRLQQAADSYTQNEAQTTQVFSNIARTLDANEE